MDLLAVCEAVLTSPWLVPALVVLVAMDGPLPVVPSESILMTAIASAFLAQDVVAVAGLFGAALLGSVLGDLLVFALGRSSHRLGRGRLDAGGALLSWVRLRLLGRPGVALVGARFLPGGRLLSTAAAGRFGLAPRRFLLASSISGLAWTCYMVLVGLAIGPLTGGQPLYGLLAGAVLAGLTAGGIAVTRRIRARLPGRSVLVEPAG